MKGNLHFIVFGICAVTGIVLAFFGASSKSSTTDSFKQQSAALVKYGNTPTKGDIAQAKKKRAEFDKSIKAAKDTLKKIGGGLTRDLPTPTKASSYYTNEGRKIIQTLKMRASALEGEFKKPKWVIGNGLRVQEVKNPFDQLGDEALAMSSDELVRPFQIRLRIIGELLTIAEALLAREEYKDGSGFKITKLDFEVEIEKKKGNEFPFEYFPFRVEFDADQSLATAIMDEFINPSMITKESVMKVDDKDVTNQRYGFPVELLSYATMQARRPESVMLKIDREVALSMGLDKKIVKDGTGWKNQMIKLAAHKDLKKIRLSLPMRCELKMAALQLNYNWTPIKEEE